MTDDEKSYLRIAYKKGYRYIAKDLNGRIYFYKKEPTRAGVRWTVKMTKVHDIFESMLDFDVFYEDEEPTKIDDLLNTGDIDWTQVKPFTPVWVRDEEDEEWVSAYFLEYMGDEDERERFKATYYSKWTNDGTFYTWKYCRLATQDEINKVFHEEEEVTQEQKVPTTAKAPEGYKLNTLYVETKTKRLQLVLQPSLFNRVKKGAKQAGLSVNEYVHRILDEATKGEE